MSDTDSSLFAMFHAGTGIILLLSSVSPFKLAWQHGAFLQSLAKICISCSSALGKTFPAARAGFAQVQVASYQLLPAAKW